MSAPKIIIQILITGTQIFGKALLEAGRQAAKNAKHRPQGATGGDIAGVGNATTGSLTDKLTREHRMTIDEAHLILNTKREDALERVLQNYEHLFKANAPPEAPPKPAAGSRGAPAPRQSHYLQSKVVRARERIEAELKVAAEEPPSPPTPPPPPPPPAASGPTEGAS
ncbi:Pam16-domain-containing protein [Gloeopeniophorella convolvens]|nr:Pam16-domain-containing protein [Gloeopeniophorella convolvens]